MRRHDSKNKGDSVANIMDAGAQGDCRDDAGRDTGIAPGEYGSPHDN